MGPKDKVFKTQNTKFKLIFLNYLILKIVNGLLYFIKTNLNLNYCFHTNSNIL